MAKYQGNDIGPQLQKLIQLPRENQPYLAIFVKADNCIYEGLKIDPQHCEIKNEGKEISLAARRESNSCAIYFFYWTMDCPNEEAHEITWVQVLN